MLTILQKWYTDYRALLNTLLVLVVILIIAAFVLLNPWLRDWIAANINAKSPRPDWIATAALSALVGIGELIARYKDAPFLALLTPSALLYSDQYCSCSGSTLLDPRFRVGIWDC